MRRGNKKPIDPGKIVQNFIEYLTQNWGIDSKKLAPGLQKEFKEFNYGRYGMIGGLLVLFFMDGLTSWAIGGGLIYWGYRECAKIYPRLKDDLEFHRSIHKND